MVKKIIIVCLITICTHLHTMQKDFWPQEINNNLNRVLIEGYRLSKQVADNFSSRSYEHAYDLLKVVGNLECFLKCNLIINEEKKQYISQGVDAINTSLKLYKENQQQTDEEGIATWKLFSETMQKALDIDSEE